MKKKSKEPPAAKKELCGDVVGDVQVSSLIDGITTSRGLPRSPVKREESTESTGKAKLRSRMLRAIFAGISPRPVFAASAAIATLALAACVEPATTGTAFKEGSASASHAHIAADGLTNDQRSTIARVRHATERYHDVNKAIAAGYTAQYPSGCAASAAGGQGFHYLNPSLVDARIELLSPELVMYEPQADGKLQLVGVDYVVPFTAWKSAEPPTLLGVPFMRNEPLGVWALHIWNWRPNPSGMFAMWNPSVSCANAN